MKWSGKELESGLHRATGVIIRCNPGKILTKSEAQYIRVSGNIALMLPILSSAKLVVENRLKEASASAYTQDVDDMIDEEMRRQKTDFVRTSMKKSIRTYTYKLLNKAEANIEAAAEGKFGLGVYRTGGKE